MSTLRCAYACLLLVLIVRYSSFSHFELGQRMNRKILPVIGGLLTIGLLVFTVTNDSPEPASSRGCVMGTDIYVVVGNNTLQAAQSPTCMPGSDRLQPKPLPESWGIWVRCEVINGLGTGVATVTHGSKTVLVTSKTCEPL